MTMNKYVYLIVSWDGTNDWNEEVIGELSDEQLLEHLTDKDSTVAHWIIEAQDERTACLIGQGHAFEAEFPYNESYAALFEIKDPKIQKALKLLEIQKALEE